MFFLREYNADTDSKYEVMMMDLSFESDRGVNIITDRSLQPFGFIHFERSHFFDKEVEVSYSIFDEKNMSKGVMTKALGLFIKSLFVEVENIDTIFLRIRPDNFASQRVATKNLFELDSVVVIKDGTQMLSYKLDKQQFINN